MHHNFSTVNKDDLVSVDRSELTEVVVNSIFRTEDPFDEKFFVLAVRGSTKTKGPGADYELISDQEFRVDCYLSDNDNIVATYLKK